MSDRGSHFLNETIEVLTAKFMILHKKSTLYYPHANGQQAKSTKKILVAILTKTISATRTDWELKLPAVLWAYRTMWLLDAPHSNLFMG